MPVSFLTEGQTRRYGQFNGELSPEELARYFHLNDTDLHLIARRRWPHMRLGFGIQLGTVRFLGTFLDDPTCVPPGVIKSVARQIGVVDLQCLEKYREGYRHWRHAAEIRERLGYRPFIDPLVQFRLNRWLYALCWTGSDRPGVLFDRAIAWLLGNKVLLPGLSVLERAVARVRVRANEELWRRLTKQVTPEQRERLEHLIVIPENERKSLFDQLRDGPVLQSPAELGRAVGRLEQAQALAAGLPSLDRLPATRITALARFAGAAKAQAISRLPDDRRIATLLAFIHTLEASAQDDVLDLFDVVVTAMFANAKSVGQRERLGSIRDLDAAALKLREVCAVVLDDGTPNDAVRQAVFDLFSREDLTEAMARIESLARPQDDQYFKELRAQHRRLRFMPSLLRTISFDTAPAGRPILDAIEYLRSVVDDKPRPGPAPMAFVPEAWKRQVRTENDVLDMTGYRLCLLDRMRVAIRRRDLFVSPSFRFGDPRKGLLDGAAWDAARPAVCRTLGVSSNAAEEIDRLSQRLDEAFRHTASNLPQNANLRIEEVAKNPENPDLILSPLDKLEEPPSLVALRAAVDARMPRVDLPEQVLEIHARTGFADEFNHASEAHARAQDLAISVSAVLLSEACNTGLEPMIRPGLPALRRARLSWVKQNYIRADTLTMANAKLVAAQNSIDLVEAWGAGEVASADGIRFVVPVRTIHAGPNPKYFGHERGVTYYNMTSDQFTGLNGVVVPGTLRDSLVLLSVVLEQETELKPIEIMTDTGAYSDTIFGIFYLLGFQFSPRIADSGGSRLWRIDPKADYGAFNRLATDRVNMNLISDHWDDLLRLAGSLKLGVAQASGLMRMLQTNNSPTKLARALADVGRIIKTMHLLKYFDDEAYRRRILVQLNRGEARHMLARAVFHGKRGELRQRYRQGQEDQLGALGLIVNAVVLWNTIYMDAALKQLRKEGFQVLDEDVARLSPLGHEHINMLGRYAFTLPACVAHGELRPLRNPNLASDDG
jgi:TnpA family transposase